MAIKDTQTNCAPTNGGRHIFQNLLTGALIELIRFILLIEPDYLCLQIHETCFGVPIDVKDWSQIFN